MSDNRRRTPVLVKYPALPLARLRCSRFVLIGKLLQVKGGAISAVEGSGRGLWMASRFHGFFGPKRRMA